MTTYFISDLHLDLARPDISTRFEKFLDFLTSSQAQAETLYILGDFFDYWIGDDYSTPFIVALSKKLKIVSSQLPIFLMPGNRDFLLGQKFALASGCQMIADPYRITLGKQQILLTHGDLLCTQDAGYQRYRRVVRNYWVQKCYLAFPLTVRLKIARHFRQTSQQATQQKAYEIMDASPAAIHALLENTATDLLIHGHTHRPVIEERRIVLGAWEKTPSVLQYDADQFSFLPFF